ncbi:hypothetical protein B9Z38_14060 [Limnohabitans sp. MMS-10A-160]|nr:hypothetical protein B9Z43_15485 [Limnohabitans sp. MMS-10A-192]PUE23114.1 hypothetical protein B9Z38_14060 [Limnohabitans sp. MMS-10A-160]
MLAHLLKCQKFLNSFNLHLLIKTQISNISMKSKINLRHRMKIDSNIYFLIGKQSFMFTLVYKTMFKFDI